MPAIMVMEVTRNQEGLSFKVGWIRGVKHGSESGRTVEANNETGDLDEGSGCRFLHG